MRRSAIRMAAPAVLIVALVAFAITQIFSGGGTSVADAQLLPPLPSDEAKTVSAVGVGQVQAAVDAGYSLSIGIDQQSAGADALAAVRAVQDKIGAVRAALVGIGIPANKIVVANFNISPAYGPYPPVPIPVEGTRPGPIAPDPATQGYMVNANLQVDTASPEQLATAMQAAIAAGATSAGSFGKGGPQGPPPDSSALAPAIQQATEQAKAMARASADAAGVSLGSIRSVSVQPPAAIFTGPGPGASYWQLQVKVTYNIGP